MSIHPTAIVDSQAEIDPSVEIGPHCIIDANVSIAAGCRLMHNVFVTGWTSIDEGCVIHPGAIIGHEPQDAKYNGARSFCRVGRNVVLREYVTIHRGTDPESETVVGDDCFLLAGSHVAHNCMVGRGVTLINDVLLGGHVHVHDRAVLGGSARVHQFVRIGALAMVAGNAFVTMDIVPFALADREGRVAGLNRVGLRRAGFSRESTAAIREVYRVYFNRGRAIEERLTAVSDLPRSDAVSAFVQFVTSPSKRGVAGRAVRGRGEPDAG